MNKRATTALALGAGALGTSLAATSVAEANATSCAYRLHAAYKTCFDVQTAVSGERVSQLVVYRSLLSAGAFGLNVTATPLMIDPAGRVIHRFKSKSLERPVPWDHKIVVHCDKLYDGNMLDQNGKVRPFDTPCHTWPREGYKLGMQVDYSGAHVGTGFADPVGISAK